MQLYQITTGRLMPVTTAQPVQAGLKETTDLEAWIRSTKHIFDRERILWVSRQERTTPDERADLLGICEDELLLVELKRDVVPKEAVAQALSYMARHAKSDRAELLRLFIGQAAATGKWALLDAPLDAAVAEKRFEEHELQDAGLNQFQTILLVGTDFTPEALQVCSYLNDVIGTKGQLTIECWRLFLFERNGDHLCTFDKVLPSKDVQSEIEDRREALREGKGKRDRYRIDLMWRFKQACGSVGVSAASSRGQSYECKIALSDGRCIYFTDYPGEAESVVWVPINSPEVNLEQFKKHGGELRDQEYWTVKCLCEDWTDASARDATVKRALSLVQLALKGAQNFGVAT